MDIAESVFLVTGGSSGLGAAVARTAFAAGARVVLVDLAEPQAEVFLMSDRVVWVKADVTNEAEAQSAVDTAVRQFGRLDVLVNAAGIAPAEKLFGKNGVHALDTFTRTVGVNLIGTFNMMRVAVPAMIKYGAKSSSQCETASNGVIVNTASVAAFDGQMGQVAYAASKGGVVAMTLPAARDLAQHKVRVMTIAPGIFETPMLKVLSPEVQERLGQNVPHPARLGKPDEYAAIVRSIVENEYLNGEVIRIDGALRMSAR